MYDGRTDLNSEIQMMAKITNKHKKQGSLADVLKGADVFIGLSAPGILTAEMVATMNKDPMVFACANPVPEIYPDEAKKGGAAVIGTGRSDFPPTRSTTCWPSPACSAALWMCAPATSTTR